MCVAYNLENINYLIGIIIQNINPIFGIFRENKKTHFCWKIEKFDDVFKKLIRDMLSKKKE